MIWILIIGLTTVFSIAFTLPIIRPTRLISSHESEESLMQSFLEKKRLIEKDQRHGILNQSATEDAVTELTQQTHQDFKALESLPHQPKTSLLWPSTIIALIFLGSIGLYWLQGSPQMPVLLIQHENIQKRVQQSQQVAMKIIERLEANAAQNPDNPQVKLMLARAYILDPELLGKAERILKETLLAFPNTPEAYSLLVQVALKKNAGIVDKKAYDLIKRALEVNPQDTTSLYYLGWWHLQNQEKDKAADVWGKVIEIAPQDAPFIENLTRKIKEINAPPPKEGGAD